MYHFELYNVLLVIATNTPSDLRLLLWVVQGHISAFVSAK